MTKKKDNGKEIIWNIVNSLLAGALVFLGSLSTGHITWESVGVAFIALLVVAMTKFKDYWNGEQKEYSTKLFKFL